ncbi:endosomal transmembrane epsin interactor 1 isoform X2 [Apus apus]|uniref:endosomal transmembrane epsin interactor 1 isoform X2 n=1 Tax=Apus apus TaxID=8895 RepID=UPI0021F89FC0|nr:endosomal transmembrane epsin interactor 1 isoform X2 [Apus apus]
MSLPVVLPGSCCPVPGLAPLPQGAAGSLPAAAADPSLLPLGPGGCRNPGLPQPRNPGAGELPARPLLSLGLLQIFLGFSLVALNFVTLSLSGAPQVKNACPFWTGASVNLFVTLSVICVLLGLAGFILGCQGLQFVSSVPRCDLMDIGEKKVCFCCQELHLTKCSEETALKLNHMKSCSAVHLRLKKLLFALCTLSALTTTVCLVAAALPYLRVCATGRSNIGEAQVEDQHHFSDPDDFVPPVPPPSYFAIFHPGTPQVSRRMRGSDVIPLHHIYGARIKGVEVFCPLDPPPPYEDGPSQSSSEQEGELQRSVVEVVDLGEVSNRRASQDEEMPESSSRVSLSPSNASPVPGEGASRRAFNLSRKWSRSDPVLHYQLPQGAVLSCEAATQTEVKPELCAVTLRKNLRERVLRGRPHSLIDYKFYTDTKLLVSWFLEQSSWMMSPDIHELVEDIKSVLKSDEKHMSEVITSATFLEQAMAPAQQAMSLSAHELPSRQHLHLEFLHLDSCGDLNTFTTYEDHVADRRIQRAEHKRPHSLIGVVRETVL